MDFPWCSIHLTPGASTFVKGLADRHLDLMHVPFQIGAPATAVPDDLHQNMVCQPLEQKRNATSFKSALFSLPYGVASALVRGHVSLEDFTLEAIQDERVRSVVNKIEPFVDSDIERLYGRTLGPAVVEVIMKTGRKRSCRVDFVKGNPQNPMTMEEYEEKFRKCLSFSGRQIGEEKASAFIKTVKELDRLDDVSRIVNYLK